MALSPTAVHDAATAVLGCVCEALAAAALENPGQPGCPSCRACIVPGHVAWDACDDPCDETGGQGQLSVTVLKMFPSSEGAFPGEARQVWGTRECTAQGLTAVELMVTILRCAPGPTEGGCPPSCTDLEKSAAILHRDMTTVYNAMLCCFPSTSKRRRGQMYALGAQTVVGPKGGCVGLEQRLTVALPACNCPTEP